MGCDGIYSFACKCTATVFWAGEKTCLSTQGTLKLAKCINANVFLMQQWSPELAKISFVAVHYVKYTKPVQYMVEVLSLFLAVSNFVARYKDYKGDFKTSVGLFKATCAVGAEACTTYKAEQKIGTANESALGFIGKSFGSTQFFAKTDAETVKGRFFLGIALSDFALFFKRVLDTSGSSFTKDVWTIKWSNLLSATYKEADTKTVLTLSGDVAKLWLAFFMPEKEKWSSILVSFTYTTGYYKFLMFDEVNIPNKCPA